MATIRNKLNVIWIVVDGARNYRTGLDDRDRIDAMDRMRDEAVDFETAVTSAPSSILSGAAMMTGMDCAYIARHFSDFRFDPERIGALPNFLRQNGYQIITVHDSHECREVMKDIILPLPYPRFPKGISHGNWWTNREIFDIFKYQFTTGYVQEPGFFFIWYDAREDPEVSDVVEETISLLKEQGIFDNAIFILCSDHGYPDPSTGLTWEIMKKFGGHDMVITDDNIMVPLLISYPGAPVGKAVKDIVGTIDIVPTILDLLDVDDRAHLTSQMQGRSLVPLIEGKAWDADRLVRTDTRLHLAENRVTALRGTSYKYVFYHDTHNEAFYDLQSDPKEMTDVIDSPDHAEAVQRCRSALKESQDAIDAFHLEEMADNYEKNAAKLCPPGDRKNVESIIVVTQAPAMFLRRLVASLRETFPNAEIDYLVDQSKPAQEGLDEVGFDDLVACDKITPQNISEGIKQGRYHRYDLVLVTTENHKQILVVLDMRIVRLFKKWKFAIIDYNMQVYSRFLRKWIWPFRRFIDSWDFYRYEPRLFIKDLFRVLKSGFASRILRKKTPTLDAEWAKKRRDRSQVLAGKYGDRQNTNQANGDDAVDEEAVKEEATA